VARCLSKRCACTPFRITGEFTVLYNFESVFACEGLVRDANGSFFGTAYGNPDGAVFEVEASGNFIQLHVNESRSTTEIFAVTSVSLPASSAGEERRLFSSHRSIL
jgi:hypothetical protein